MQGIYRTGRPVKITPEKLDTSLNMEYRTGIYIHDTETQREKTVAVYTCLIMIVRKCTTYIYIYISADLLRASSV